MKYLDNNSLSKTIDNVSEAMLFGLEISENEKLEIADFIVDQHYRPDAYANTFAPTDRDLKQDLILFTGEKIKSRVGKCHIIGEEASRILRKLDLKIDKVQTALQQADDGLQNRINSYVQNERYEYGMYCCKTCSCSLWINMASGGLRSDTEFLVAGLDYLKQFRDSKRGWKGFPYFYTLFVLNEISPDLAMDEMIYISEAIENRLKKKRANDNKYNTRRDYICSRILDKVNRN